VPDTRPHVWDSRLPRVPHLRPRVPHLRPRVGHQRPRMGQAVPVGAAGPEPQV